MEQKTQEQEELRKRLEQEYEQRKEQAIEEHEEWVSRQPQPN